MAKLGYGSDNEARKRVREELLELYDQARLRVPDRTAPLQPLWDILNSHLEVVAFNTKMLEPLLEAGVVRRLHDMLVGFTESDATFASESVSHECASLSCSQRHLYLNTDDFVDARCSTNRAHLIHVGAGQAKNTCRTSRLH